MRLGTSIGFTDEQSMLLDTASDFFRNRSPVAAVRAQLSTDAGHDDALWREMTVLGWTGLAIPVEYGGSGLTLAEAVTIAEPMGRALCATPLLSSQLFAQGLVAGGSDAQQSEFLGRVCGGSPATVALFESQGSWGLNQISCRADLDRGRVHLAGAKTLVNDASAAESILVSVMADGAPALVIVKRSELPKGATARETVIDETRRSFRVNLDGISIAEDRLIVGDAALRALRAIRDGALLLLSAEAAGGIAGVLDLTVEYLNTRTAFGRKIGSYQSLKHTCAEILIGLERARSHLYHAATLVAAGEDSEAALRMAKAESSTAFAFAADRAVQFHGGFGFTYECDAQLYLRRALWLQYAFGDAAHHRKHLARLLLPTL